MKKTRWFSIRTLKCHEFNTTLRKMHGQLAWNERYKLLDDLEKRATKQFIKLGGYITLAYLLIASLKSDDSLTLKFQGVQVSVPAAYFLSVSSLLFLLTTIAFCHLTVALTLKAKESAKNLNHGFSSSIYGLIEQESDDLAFGLSLHRNNFFKEKLPVSNVLAQGTILATFGTLIPLFALGVFIAMQQIGLMKDNTISLFQIVACISGILLVSFSFLYLILYHAPLPVEKDKFLVRWGFLWNIPRNGKHPQVDEWLRDR